MLCNCVFHRVRQGSRLSNQLSSESLGGSKGYVVSIPEPEAAHRRHPA